MIINRKIIREIEDSLSVFPAVAIVGPRQVGKTTLAKSLNRVGGVLYLDLELPSDLAKLDDAEFYLREHKDKLICLDEIQRCPELFPILRALIDEERRPGKFLILGSASPNLLQQSSESLAGRIAYHELDPIQLDELTGNPWRVILTRGGFPESYLAKDDRISLKWRDNFLLTFVERDLRFFGVGYNPTQMRRLWIMLAHINGQVVNYSKLSQSLDVTHPTIKRYLDILTDAFMLFRLDPYIVNTKKRLVKSPKFYFNDPGILAALLELETFELLYNHPSYGSLWEGVAIKSLISKFQPKLPYGFYRSHQGEEVDLVLEKKGKKIAFEFKVSSSPNISDNGLKTARFLGAENLYVITPESDTYTKFDGGVIVTSLLSILSGEVQV